MADSLVSLVEEVRWASVSLYEAEDKHGLKVWSKEWAQRWSTLGLSIEKLIKFASEHDR